MAGQGQQMGRMLHVDEQCPGLLLKGSYVGEYFFSSQKTDINWQNTRAAFNCNIFFYVALLASVCLFLFFRNNR